MGFLISYFLKRLPREGFKSLSVPVLALVLAVLINIMGGVKAQMEAEYEDVRDNYKIHFEISDGDGTVRDGLAIGENLLERFVDPEVMWSLSEFIGDIRLSTEVDLVSVEEQLQTGAIQAWAILVPSAIQPLASHFGFGGNDIEFNIFPEAAEIMSEIPFYDVWNACFISENLLSYIEDVSFAIDDLYTVEKIINTVLAIRRGPNTITYDIPLSVMGTVSGVDDNMIFTGYFSFQRRYWEASRNYLYLSYLNEIDAEPGEDGEGDGDEDGDEDVDVDGDGDEDTDVDFDIILNQIPYVGPLELSLLPPGDKIEDIGVLRGLSSASMIESLVLDGGSEIVFYEGYDESVFDIAETSAEAYKDGNSDRFALVSEDFLDMVENGVLSVSLISRGSWVSDIVDVEFNVIGYVPDSEGVIYSTFQTVRDLGEASAERPPFATQISGTLANNEDLDAFKAEAMRSFSRVGVFFNPQQYAMTIFDAEYYDKTEVLRQTLFFVDIATPFVYIIAVSIGFIASFLLTRRRKSEFANMRSVGVGKMRIFCGALFEQTLLCASGVMLGCVLFRYLWGDVFLTESALFLGCYMLGAVISAAKAAGTDVLRLLREKE